MAEHCRLPPMGWMAVVTVVALNSSHSNRSRCLCASSAFSLGSFCRFGNRIGSHTHRTVDGNHFANLRHFLCCPVIVSVVSHGKHWSARRVISRDKCTPAIEAHSEPRESECCRYIDGSQRMSICVFGSSRFSSSARIDSVCVCVCANIRVIGLYTTVLYRSSAWHRVANMSDEKRREKRER